MVIVCLCIRPALKLFLGLVASLRFNGQTVLEYALRAQKVVRATSIGRLAWNSPRWGLVFLHGTAGRQSSARIPITHGSAMAISFGSNCGATTPFAYSAVIKSNGEELDLNHDMRSSVTGEPDIEVIWDSGSQLTIVYDKPERGA
jgi:hypothetical protein